MAAKYKDIELAFDFVNSAQPCEHQAYLNIHTGETYWYTEFDDNEDELPDDIDDTRKSTVITMNYGLKIRFSLIAPY